MNKKSTKEDFSSFYAEFKDVTPLKKNDRIDLYAHKKNAQPYKDENHYEEDTFQVFLSDEQHHGEVSGETFIFFARSGLQQKTQKHLRQGKITIEDHLDLHGLTINEARKILLEFINYAQKQQIRCIHLVHGKGYRSDQQQPILKNKINSWLRQHPDVLAFSSALPQDGGTGALYILIKTLKK